MDVAIVGGTGEEGFGLALRLAQAGAGVVIGSRSEERGAAAANRAVETLGVGANVVGTTNELAVTQADTVIVTVPFEGQAETYRTIRQHLRAGGVVMDATSPLATAVGGRAWHVVRPWHGSAAEQAAAIVGERARMTAGFHTISARALMDVERPMESDVLVCGDDQEAKTIVGALVERIPGLRWVDCGLLSQARIAETMTALLVSINRQYGIHDSGFRITGRDDWGGPKASD